MGMNCATCKKGDDAMNLDKRKNKSRKKVKTIQTETTTAEDPSRN